MSEWQTIDTAPVGEPIWIGHISGLMAVAIGIKTATNAAKFYWRNYYGGLPVDWRPSHWQPVPKPPEALALPSIVPFEHEFSSDWYRPSSCMLCSYKREHPIHVRKRETPSEASSSP